MKRIYLVQQAGWHNTIESMPLASAYLKGFVEADDQLAGEVTVEIFNIAGGERLSDMARNIFSGGTPDAIGFSVLGWNLYNFAALAETFKQINPGGLVIFGGNHVAYQAERVMNMYPQVDVIVNGEGEITLRNIIAKILENPKSPELHLVKGVSIRDGGRLFSSPDEDRIDTLDIIPSPILSRAIPLVNDKGEFRYEVALMETNRGCPYKCAFCYWGGAVGQKVRSFSRERLREELDILGHYRVPTVCLCDANFGMLEADEHFVEDLIATKQKYGYPNSIESSWAKNKSERFHRIVTMLKEHNLKGSFTLSLQTLSDEALTDMQRRNMKVNQWEPLVDWLTEQGLDCYAELIWGAPGETPQSFKEGYDRLAAKVPRIAVYPLLLLPNTSYTKERESHGFVTVRGESDDFEYVLANRSATLQEHLTMQRFTLWARILGEHQFFRHLWRPLSKIAGVTQSEVIDSVREYFDTSRDPAVQAFAAEIPTIAESPATTQAVRHLYSNRELDAALNDWWQTHMVPRFPADWRRFAASLYRFESWSRPLYVPDGTPLPESWSPMSREGNSYYVSEPVNFDYPMPEVLAGISSGRTATPKPYQTTYTFLAPQGFADHTDNHEIAAYYVAVANGDRATAA